MSSTIRLMVPADLDPARALLAEVGLGSGVANVARYLRWQPDGVWVAVDGASVVGMVALLHQGVAGFVGCMAVAPTRQGAGLGRLLLEHAHAAGRRAGLATFLLEATASGAHLYRRLGYVAEYETIIATRTAGATVSARIDPADHAGILALDRGATGVTRDAMVEALLAEGGPGVATATGYGLIIGERLGPVIARDAATGRAIFDALAPAAAVITVPVPNADALAAATAHGFVEQRRLWRMRLGPAVAVRPVEVWALASAGAG
jgi:GNAT superfamily N-acetyltransferase